MARPSERGRTRRATGERWRTRLRDAGERDGARRLAGGLPLVALLVAGFLAVPAAAWRLAPPPGRVGACGFGPTCRDAGCHASFPIGSPTLTWSLDQEAPEPGALPPAYVPLQEYVLRLAVVDTDPAAVRWGFQLAALARCPTPGAAGEVVLLDPQRTQVEEEAGIAYLGHSCACVPAEPECCGLLPELVPGVNGWSFRWRAPPRGVGETAFHFTVNAADGDGTPDGDRIVIGEVVLPEEACPPRVTDLRLRKADCDAGAPGELRLALEWTPAPQAPSATVRSTSDRARLADAREDWTQEPDACRPLGAPPLVFYSVADDCELGSEGVH